MVGPYHYSGPYRRGIKFLAAGHRPRQLQEPPFLSVSDPISNSMCIRDHSAVSLSIPWHCIDIFSISQHQLAFYGITQHSFAFYIIFQHLSLPQLIVDHYCSEFSTLLIRALLSITQHTYLLFAINSAFTGSVGMNCMFSLVRLRSYQNHRPKFHKRRVRNSGRRGEGKTKINKRSSYIYYRPQSRYYLNT